MINVTELRLGNYLLQKVNQKITLVKCGYPHFDMVAREGTKDLYPVILKGELFDQCGFKENSNYPLLPDAHEYILLLPVIGSNQNEIRGYVKTNKECFARVSFNGQPASNNFFYLHQLQNIFFGLTGE